MAVYFSEIIWPILCFLLVTYFIYLLWVVFERISRIRNLDGRTILITGCDSGFGHDLAVRCLRRGMNVFAACLTEKGMIALTNTFTKIQKQHIKESTSVGNLTTFLLDVRSQESVNSALSFLEEKLKGKSGLHALINNAGILGRAGWDDWLSANDYELCLAVNTLGVIRVTHAFKQLVKAEYGRIIIMASSCGRVALPGCGPYTVSKFAVEAYSDILRTELLRFGVKVIILEPGFFKTPLTDEEQTLKMLDKVWDEALPQVRDEYGSDLYEFTKKRASSHLSHLASSNTESVIDTYLTAITSRWPKQRYQIGFDANLFWLFSLLPTGCQDYFFKLLKIIENPPPPQRKGNELLVYN